MPEYLNDEPQDPYAPQGFRGVSNILVPEHLSNRVTNVPRYMVARVEDVPDNTIPNKIKCTYLDENLEYVHYPGDGPNLIIIPAPVPDKEIKHPEAFEKLSIDDKPKEVQSENLSEPIPSLKILASDSGDDLNTPKDQDSKPERKYYLRDFSKHERLLESEIENQNIGFPLEREGVEGSQQLSVIGSQQNIIKSKVSDSNKSNWSDLDDQYRKEKYIKDFNLEDLYLSDRLGEYEHPDSMDIKSKKHGTHFGKIEDKHSYLSKVSKHSRDSQILEDPVLSQIREPFLYKGKSKEGFTPRQTVGSLQRFSGLHKKPQIQYGQKFPQHTFAAQTQSKPQFYKSQKDSSDRSSKKSILSESSNYSQQKQFSVASLEEHKERLVRTRRSSIGFTQEKKLPKISRNPPKLQKLQASQMFKAQEKYKTSQKK